MRPVRAGKNIGRGAQAELLRQLLGAGQVQQNVGFRVCGFKPALQFAECIGERCCGKHRKDGWGKPIGPAAVRCIGMLAAGQRKPEQHTDSQGTGFSSTGPNRALGHEADQEAGGGIAQKVSRMQARVKGLQIKDHGLVICDGVEKGTPTLHAHTFFLW